MTLEQLYARFELTGELPVIYLAGPMTGYENYNHESFNDEARRLRLLGFPVINPADLGSTDCRLAASPREDSVAYKNCMARDLPLVAIADVVVLLEGWGDSKGAKLEYQVAIAMDKAIVDCDNGDFAPFLQAFFTDYYLLRAIEADKLVEKARQVLMEGYDVQFYVKVKPEDIADVIDLLQTA